jgi:hypothetical protein
MRMLNTGLATDRAAHPCASTILTIPSDHIIATMTSDITVSFAATVALIPFVALLMLTTVLWRKELISMFSVLQGVRRSNLVLPSFKKTTYIFLLIPI